MGDWSHASRFRPQNLSAHMKSDWLRSRRPQSEGSHVQRSRLPSGDSHTQTLSECHCGHSVISTMPGKAITLHSQTTSNLYPLLSLFLSQRPHYTISIACFNTKVKCMHAQSCLTFCDPKDFSPPGSSDYGIFQARILKQVATSYSRGSSWARA